MRVKEIALLGVFVVKVVAQNVGVGTANPDQSAALDVYSTNKGVLLPRVTLSSLTSHYPISPQPPVSLLIFNVGGVVPRGFYWWDGDRWRQLMDSVVTANPIVGDGSLGSPITLIAGNTPGQILKWDGMQWVLENDSAGDNWGSQVVITQQPIAGDGTLGDPVRLQSGVNAGDMLIWDGNQWLVTSVSYDSVCVGALNNYVQKWTGTTLCNSIIYDNGTRVGIGTTSPMAKLDVQGSVRISSVSASGVNGAIVTADNAGFLSKLDFSGSTSNVLWGDGTWAVISTSSPVIGDGSSSNPITFDKGNSPGDIWQWNGTMWQLVSLTSAVGSAGYDSVCSSALSNYVQKWTGTTLCNSIIYDDGTKVGVGTTNLYYKLEVKGGNMGIYNAYNPPYESGIILFEDRVYSNEGLGNGNPSGGNKGWFVVAAGPLASSPRTFRIKYWDGSSWKEGITIDSFINVGINESNPKERLHVNGGNIYMYKANAKLIQESTSPNSNYSELVITQWGQGAQWAVNARYRGNGNPPDSMEYMVNAGVYNTGTGVLRFDGNRQYWAFYVGPPSTGVGNIVPLTKLAHISDDRDSIGIWFSPKGNPATFNIDSNGRVGIGTAIPRVESHQLEVVGGHIAIDNASQGGSSVILFENRPRSGEGLGTKNPHGGNKGWAIIAMGLGIYPNSLSFQYWNGSLWEYPFRVDRNRKLLYTTYNLRSPSAFKKTIYASGSSNVVCDTAYFPLSFPPGTTPVVNITVGPNANPSWGQLNVVIKQVTNTYVYYCLDSGSPSQSISGYKDIHIIAIAP